MVVSFKDIFKSIGVIIVVFCAVFVCTFFLNFYLDAKSIEGSINDVQTEILFNAQMATAKFTCALSGGFLGVIAVVMLVFYIKLYVDRHAKQLGIIKAMGYSDLKIALRFAVFGISVLLGALLGFGTGFIFMPMIYDNLSISGLPEIKISFHFSLVIFLIIVPTIIFSILSCFYGYVTLRRPVSELLRGKSQKIKLYKVKKEEKERSFLKEMCLKTLFCKKSLAFFVAFACFCFSAMVQMGASMYELSTEIMGWFIFIIGVILAVTTIFMAITALVNGNNKNISMMKALGYSLKNCALTVLGGYHLFALLGFALGTVYQFGLLNVMVNIIFKDVGTVPEYKFNVPIFFITLVVFIVFYELVMMFYTIKINRISVKEVMTEN